MTQLEQGVGQQNLEPTVPKEPGGLTEFLMPWMLAAFSPSFYSHAGRRPAWRAVAFLLVFIAANMLVLTAGLTVRLQSFRETLAEQFRTGGLPEITLSNGRLTLHGQNPYVAGTAGGRIVVDTTGTYNVSDVGPGSGDVSILMTETEYAAWDQDGQIQEFSWSDLQPVFGAQPFEFNAATLYRWLDAFVIGTFFLGGAFFSAVWLTYVAVTGLLVWGLAALIHRGTEFRQVLIAGLYAVVPAWYVYALSTILLPDVSVLLLWGSHTAAWILGMASMIYLKPGQATDGPLAERPLRPWRALIALPLLLVIQAYLFFDFTDTLRWVTAGLALLTAAVLVSLRLSSMLRSGEIVGAA